MLSRAKAWLAGQRTVASPLPPEAGDDLIVAANAVPIAPPLLAWGSIGRRRTGSASQRFGPLCF